MIAILLGAGYATRMYPLTQNFPKSLLPVADKPVIDYLMEQLMHFPGLDEIHLVTNSKYVASFETWKRTWSAGLKQKKIRFSLHNDGSSTNKNRLGAVADLRFVCRRISRPAKMLVAATDIIFRFPLLPLWQQFIKSNHHHIIALPENDQARLKRTGVLEFKGNNRVSRVHEKPEEPPSARACPALYFLQPPAHKRMDEFMGTADNPDELGYFIDFLCQKEIVYAFKLNSSRLDIGNLEAYREADKLLRNEPLFGDG